MTEMPPGILRLLESGTLIPWLVFSNWVLWRAYSWKRDQVEKMIERLMEHARLMDQVKSALDELRAELRSRAGGESSHR